MTDRHAGYIVTLAQDVREDHTQATINAIKQIQGVVDVTPMVADIHMSMANSRAKRVWHQRLLNLMREDEE